MKINVIVYTDSSYEEIEIQSIEEIKNINREGKNLWIDVVGLDDKATISQIGEYFDINELVTRELMEEDSLSKYENYNDYFYISFGITRLDIGKFKNLEHIKISFVMFDDKLISFRDEESNLVDETKKILELSHNPKLKNQMYLLFLILDSIINKFYEIIEKIGEYVDKLEDDLLEEPDKKILQDIYELKRNFIFIRKSLWAIRNMLNSISIGDEIIDESSIYYVKSVYNDVIQIIDLVETYREICSGMLDTYLSSISNKTNDVMKTLTIVSTIFTPISFYSGLYMMVFKDTMSYYVFWGMTIVTVIGLLFYFEKKGWI